MAVINADDAFAGLFHRAGRSAAHAALRPPFRRWRCRGGLTRRHQSRFDLVTPAGAIQCDAAAGGRAQRPQRFRGERHRCGPGRRCRRSKPGWKGAQHVKGRLLRHDLSAGWLSSTTATTPNRVPRPPHRDAGAGAGDVWLVLGDMKELGPEAARACTQTSARWQGARHCPAVQRGTTGPAQRARPSAGARGTSPTSPARSACASSCSRACCLVDRDRAPRPWMRVVAALFRQNGGGDAHAA